MKFILEPSVYLITTPYVDRANLERFLEEHGYNTKFANEHQHHAEQAIATGSRTCYQSFDNGRSPDDHIRHLIEVGHGSVLEHAIFGLLCTGISRSCTHELVRHRHLSPSQLSQRYVEHIEEDIAFVVPPALLPYWKESHPDQYGYIDRTNKWREDCQITADRYTYWLDFFKNTAKLPKKEAAQAARAKLTNEVETRIFLTGNLRAWRGFFDQRCSTVADAEIRRLACKCFNAIQPFATTVFSDYDKADMSDGTFVLHTANRKV